MADYHGRDRFFCLFTTCIFKKKGTDFQNYAPQYYIICKGLNDERNRGRADAPESVASWSFTIHTVIELVQVHDVFYGLQ